MVLFCALWRYTKRCCELSSGIQGVSCLNMYKRISKANVRFSVLWSFPLIIIRPNSVVSLKEQRIPLYQKEGLQDDRSQPSENWYWHKKMSKYRVRETIKSVQTTSELNLEHFSQSHHMVTLNQCTKSQLQLFLLPPSPSCENWF